MIPDLEVEMGRLRGPRAFSMVDLLRSYWQCPLALEAHEIFTIATLKGLLTPTRILQGGTEYDMLPSHATTQVGGAGLHDVDG